MNSDDFTTALAIIFAAIGFSVGRFGGLGPAHLREMASLKELVRAQREYMAALERKSEMEGKLIELLKISNPAAGGING